MRIQAVFAAGLALALAFSGPAAADTEQVEAALAKAFPGRAPDSIQESAVDGLYEVIYGANVFYVTADGQHLLHGNLIQLDGLKNLTAERLNGLREHLLDAVADDQTVIFPAAKEKYRINVFTDIDCGYCRKLHKQIDKINAEGITVRYLFFPRSGPGSHSWEKAEWVWCAKDRGAALTAAKNGAEPEAKTCDNPVQRHWDLVQKLDLNGTPSIVLENGRLIPGYVTPEKLAQLAAQAATP